MFNLTSFEKDAHTLVDVVFQDMATIKTGRAKPSLLENVFVEAYGTKMRVIELASVTSPEPALLIVSPWDKTLLTAIQKGIQHSSLGLNPVVDSDRIRIAIPALTQERRKEMVRFVKQKLENGKQMLRDLRIKYKKQIDDQKGKPGISEDDITYDLEQLQKKVEEFSKKLEELATTKEVEVMRV